MTEPASAEPASAHRNVLCACEDEDILDLLCEHLDTPELRGRIVRNRHEVLKDAGFPEADILLMDEDMGVIDGWNTARLARQARGTGLIIIAMVGELDGEVVTRARGLGVDSFIRKDMIDAKLVSGLGFLARKVPVRPTDDPAPYQSFANLLEHDPTDTVDLAPPARTDTARTDTARTDTARTDTAGAADLADPEPRSEDRDTVPIVIGDDEDDDHTAELNTRPPPEDPAEAEATMLSRNTPPPFARPSTRKRTRKPPKPVPADQDLSGVMLGKVLLEELIGSGAGGAVYRGLHTNLDLPVAVKVLHPKLAAQDAEYARSFLAEARLAARISHANVIRVLDCDRDDGGTNCYYIVMEFVSGRSLQDELDATTRVSEERLTGIAIGVAHALVAASKHNVIHRDIKPANIMLDEDDLVKVADLGLAKRVTRLSGLGTSKALTSAYSSRPSTQQLEQAAIVGTPHYMAPEQITAPESADVRTDIYSLGATLYHAATGRPPFQGDSVEVILLQQVEDAPISPRQIVPDLSPELSRIILRMMEKDPARRPAGPRDVLGILRDHHVKASSGTRRSKRVTSWFGKR